nr:PREDICTED: uncharacterized protein LOC109029801 [Bemisia tabaci]
MMSRLTLMQIEPLKAVSAPVLQAKGDAITWLPFSYMPTITFPKQTNLANGKGRRHLQMTLVSQSSNSLPILSNRTTEPLVTQGHQISRTCRLSLCEGFTWTITSAAGSYYLRKELYGISLVFLFTPVWRIICASFQQVVESHQRKKHEIDDFQSDTRLQR